MDDNQLEQLLVSLETKVNELSLLERKINDLSGLEAKVYALNQLEAKVERLNHMSETVATLVQRVSQLSELEQSVSQLQDSLLMIADIDTFKELQRLLVAGHFKKADQETAKILMSVINKDEDSIAPEDIESYPLAPLKIVDRLWRRYSNDNFGFSIQLQIYRDIGGDINTLIAQNQDLMFQFFERIGWRYEGQFIFQKDWAVTPSSPRGFLPLSWWITPYGLKIGNFILARLIQLGF